MGSPDNPSLEDTIRAFVRGGIATVHTSIPGTVIAYDPVFQRATIQLAIRQRVSDPLLDIERPALAPVPPISNVPVVWPSGSSAVGAWNIHGPLLPGDPVTVVFAERSTDEWRTIGAPDNIPLSARRHSRNDAVAFPGGRCFNPAVPTGPFGPPVDPAAVVISVSLPTTLKFGGPLAIDGLIKGTAFIGHLATWLTATKAMADVMATPGAPAAWVPLVVAAAVTWSAATATFLAAIPATLSLKTFTE